MNNGKWTRKSLAFLALTGVLGLTACGDKSPSATPSSSPSAQAKQELKDVELSWYYPSFGPQADQQVVEDAVNKITKEKIHATVKLKPVEIGQYTQKMNTIVAANENFDIAWTSNWNFDYFQNTNKGAFQPLDELIGKYAPDVKKSMPDFVWDATKVGGKIYGIPNYQTVTNKEGFIVQKKLVDKYQLDVNSIKKFEDIEPFLAKIKENEPTIIPMGIFKNGSNFGNVRYSYGLESAQNGAGNFGVIRTNETNLKVYNMYETPEFKQYLNTMRSWNQKGYFIKDAATLTKLPDQDKAKYGVFFHNVLKPGGEAEASKADGTEMITIPLTKPFVTTATITTTLNAVSKTSKNPERAVMLLNLINTDKQLYNTIVYGLEGKHYTKNGEVIKTLGKESGYNTNADWVFGNVFNGFVLEGKDPNVYVQTKKENESASRLKTNGFAFVSDPVNAEVANISSVTDEYLPGLYTGAVDPDKYLPEFLEKLKRAGSERVIAEVQKQLDAWAAAKK
ncbi:ABC transporter substrate-binding protein [Paenibacillus roseipurpureus]|uniref:ABC transporter substrate-binding protein n=1 Tax=Paenibacillus roseopurpureus TaxID=2918901 RepID=A0AA96LNS2_9BACL|nr:ABC transporter substrate-binding protein [Paenibacillus sp. MBLB1832]WNR45407.1 ABC transporter substrate-binding protein [Paenibacillus sp. MBLB1832]